MFITISLTYVYIVKTLDLCRSPSFSGYVVVIVFVVFLSVNMIRFRDSRKTFIYKLRLVQGSEGCLVVVRSLLVHSSIQDEDL